MKILPVVTELFQTDRGTDRRTNMTKLIVSFPSFAKALKNQLKQLVFPGQDS